MAAKLGAETRQERKSIGTILSTNQIESAGKEAGARLSDLAGPVISRAGDRKLSASQDAPRKEKWVRGYSLTH